MVNILFSEYRQRILALLLLHPGERYHVREIARRTGTVAGTTTRELGRLTDAGLLLRSRVGNQVLYKANEESPIFSELASILRKTSGLADILAEALAPLADRIEAAFVFGSAASGKASAYSDVDIIVIGNNIRYSEVVALLYTQQEVIGREINPKVYSRMEWQQLAKENSSFFRDIMSKPMLFFIGSRNELGEFSKDWAD